MDKEKSLTVEEEMLLPNRKKYFRSDQTLESSKKNVLIISWTAEHYRKQNFISVYSEAFLHPSTNYFHHEEEKLVIENT